MLENDDVDPILNDDPAPKEPEPKVEEKDEEKEEPGQDEEKLLDDEEKEEVKEDEKEPSEEDEKEEKDPEIPEGRVSPKEVKAAFPEIYKKFPDLRRVIAHEYEYAKVFGNIETARGAAQALENFDEFGKKILAGDSDYFLKQVHEQSPEAYEKFTLGFLETVKNQSRETFAKIITPYVKQILRSAQSRNDENGNYKKAGLWLQKMLQLQSLDDEAPDPKIVQKEQELEQTRKGLETDRARTFVTDTMDENKERLMGIIKRDLDPESVMTPGMQKAAAREVFEQIDELLSKDEAHLNRMNQAWKLAKQNGFNRASKDQIIRVYLERVKRVLPGIRQKVREDYLGPRRKGDAEDKPTRKSYIPSSGSSGSGKERKLDPKKLDKDFYNKHTDQEILDMD
jgi:hypothetical protein